TRFVLEKLSDRSIQPVKGFPAGARLGTPHWSPDGAWIAVVVTLEDRIELWLVLAATGEANRVRGLALNEAIGPAIHWDPEFHPGFQSLVARIVPSSRGTPPVASTTPAGPVIQETVARKAPSRTYQDLLRNAHD